MPYFRILFSVSAVALLIFASCQSGSEPSGANTAGTTPTTTGGARNDGAKALQISGGGSLQNPAFSPNSKEILFTTFTKGYNKEPADLRILNLETQNLRTLVSDGSGNVNLPGTSWHSSGKIVFASSREPHDEIYSIEEKGAAGSEKKVTERVDRVAFEPSLSPDAQWVVFESHKLDVEDNGIITKFMFGGNEFTALTAPEDDCRQPNWSPIGDLIVYQCLKSGQWDLWVMKTDGSDKRQVTSGGGDKTDASFSPDGQRLVYSSNEGGLASANLFVIPVGGGQSQRVTNYGGYDGAPSWSPDGTTIAFESFPGDPDGSAGTTLLTIPAPK